MSVRGWNRAYTKVTTVKKYERYFYVLFQQNVLYFLVSGHGAFKRIDEALYEAKETGRNKIVYR